MAAGIYEFPGSSPELTPSWATEAYVVGREAEVVDDQYQDDSVISLGKEPAMGEMDILWSMFDQDPILKERTVEVATNPVMRAVVEAMHNDPELGDELLQFAFSKYSSQVNAEIGFTPVNDQGLLTEDVDDELGVNLTEEDDSVGSSPSINEQFDSDAIKSAINVIVEQLHYLWRDASSHAIHSYDDMRSSLRFVMGFVYSDPDIARLFPYTAERPFYIREDGSLVRPRHFVKRSQQRSDIEILVSKLKDTLTTTASTIATAVKEDQPVPMSQEDLELTPLESRSWNRFDGEVADTFAYPILMTTQNALQSAAQQAAHGTKKVAETIRDYDFPLARQKRVAMVLGTMLTIALSTTAPLNSSSSSTRESLPQLSPEGSQVTRKSTDGIKKLTITEGKSSAKSVIEEIQSDLLPYGLKK